MTTPLNDLSLKFDGMHKLKTRELLMQSGECHCQLRDRGPAGATADLVGGVGLQKEHAARSERQDCPSVQISTDVRGKVGKDGDDSIPARNAEIRGREIPNSGVNSDALGYRQAMRLGDTHLREINAGDIESRAGQINGVATLSFGQAEHTTGRQTRDIAPKKVIRLGAIEVSLSAVPLVPENLGRLRVGGR
jgi:hypothetical protein